MSPTSASSAKCSTAAVSNSRIAAASGSGIMRNVKPKSMSSSPMKAKAIAGKAAAKKVTRNVVTEVTEENYTILRTLIQIRRTKHNDPNRKKDHLGFGFLSHDFFKVLLGPMMESTKKWRRTDADIKVAVRAWANPATRAAAEITYGHISDWETAQVTNMVKLFDGYFCNGGDFYMQSFNDDISRWDTSNVTTMEEMFCNAHAFNEDGIHLKSLL